MSSRQISSAVLMAWLAVSTGIAAAPADEVGGELRPRGFPGADRPLVIKAGSDRSGGRSGAPLKAVEIAAVAAYLAAQPAVAPTWSASNSTMATALKGRLQVLQDEKLVDFNPGPRPEPEFYLVYFGAGWSEPCLELSPKLVSEYRRLKQRAADRFEMIFVSQDRSSRDQLNHVRQAAMPWPVFQFSQLKRAEIITRWVGPGIPCIVVVTRTGEPVLGSYRRFDYLPPREVLGRFESLLQAWHAPAPGEGHRALHALAVLQHVRAAGSGDSMVVPYVVALNPERYHTLEVKSLMALLDVDKEGAVREASFEPALPVVLQQQLLDDARRWLFLPAVKNGKAVRTWVQLPLKINFE